MYENEDHSLGGHTDIIWQNYESFFVSVKEVQQIGACVYVTISECGNSGGNVNYVLLLVQF